MVKRSSDPRVAYPEDKVQVRDLVLPPSSHGVFGENRFIEPQKVLGTGDLCRVPPASIRHGRARQSSGTGPCGDCRKVLRVPGLRGHCSGKSFYRETRGTRREGSLCG